MYTKGEFVRLIRYRKVEDFSLGMLDDLLYEYRVDRDFQKEVREGYRVDIENLLKNVFDVRCNFRYGGSLAKSTANKNKSDIDLLSYLDNHTQMSLQDIYNTTYDTIKVYYFCEKKNSAITIHYKYGENWDYTVDVVPGKYSSNENKTDVYLWQNKSSSRLKTNPEVQISKVKESKSKDLIRLIKLYRDFNKFEFKSFFLEIFAIDVIEQYFEEGDSLQDKLIKFCSKYSEVGVVKIYDPANPNNDIMHIHDQFQYNVIQNKLKELYEVLMTDSEEDIKKCILGERYNIDDSYKKKAFSKSIMKEPSNNSLVLFQIGIKAYITNKYGEIELNDFNELKKGESLYFCTNILKSMGISNVKWIITNAGYEARKNNCLRGNKIEYSNSKQDQGYFIKYTKNENTLYYGNHFVQAVLTTNSGTEYYSNIVTVRVR